MEISLRSKLQALWLKILFDLWICILYRYIFTCNYFLPFSSGQLSKANDFSDGQDLGGHLEMCAPNNTVSEL